MQLLESKQKRANWHGFQGADPEIRQTCLRGAMAEVRRVADIMVGGWEGLKQKFRMGARELGVRGRQVAGEEERTSIFKQIPNRAWRQIFQGERMRERAGRRNAQCAIAFHPSRVCSASAPHCDTIPARLHIDASHLN